MNKGILFGVFYFFSTSLWAQIDQTNSLFFLNFVLDGRATGMGDAGLATSPDAYSHSLNPSKYIFGKTDAGISLAYSPWIPELVNDMNITEVSGYYLLDNLQGLSTSFRYFSMGNISFKDDDEQPLGNSSPFQLAFDLAYSRLLAKNFSMGITLRYVHSDFYRKTEAYEVGRAIAADISAYYSNSIYISSHPFQLTFGGLISNLGTKVKYSNTLTEFLPMQLKLGAGIASDVSEGNRLMFTTELHNNLYPKPEDNNESLLNAFFKSIGNTNATSLSWNLGLEYGLKETFFGRLGYYRQSSSNTNRQYLTLGAGAKYRSIQFDVSYLFPTGSNFRAMNKTFRLSLSLNLK